MSLTEYFKNIKGLGVLATSDADGNVDIAVYSRPYIIDEKTIAFSMLEKLSYSNIQSNPKAAYMFAEQGEGYTGKRLHLTKTGEEKDPERIKEIKQQHTKTREPDEKVRHLIYFTVDKIRPLVGDKP
ncbi:MAG: pyridoxamine 5'-phosphate oxidase [Planctomycetes bacterium RBG_19FT_COMBO_48_8]|nr:MAG: pyridoxamine 5'-phosphate oxidase [Planctomycetes bacterium RBG_19FT_COMBO_48_8]